MNIVYRKNLERILSVTEIDGNFEQLEAAVLLLQAATAGTLFEFETIAEAMALTPLPVNNVPFIVRGSTNGTEDGYYIYDSTEAGGYFKTGDFKTPGLTQTLEPTNTTEAPSNKAVADYVAAQRGGEVVEGETRAVSGGEIFDVTNLLNNKIKVSPLNTLWLDGKVLKTNTIQDDPNYSTTSKTFIGDLTKVLISNKLTYIGGISSYTFWDGRGGYISTSKPSADVTNEYVELTIPLNCKYISICTDILEKTVSAIFGIKEEVSKIQDPISIVDLAGRIDGQYYDVNGGVVLGGGAISTELIEVNESFNYFISFYAITGALFTYAKFYDADKLEIGSLVKTDNTVELNLINDLLDLPNGTKYIQISQRTKTYPYDLLVENDGYSEEVKLLNKNFNINKMPVVLNMQKDKMIKTNAIVDAVGYSSVDLAYVGDLTKVWLSNSVTYVAAISSYSLFDASKNYISTVSVPSGGVTNEYLEIDLTGVYYISFTTNTEEENITNLYAIKDELKRRKDLVSIFGLTEKEYGYYLDVNGDKTVGAQGIITKDFKIDTSLSYYLTIYGFITNTSTYLVYLDEYKNIIGSEVKTSNSEVLYIWKEKINFPNGTVYIQISNKNANYALDLLVLTNDFSEALHTSELINEQLQVPEVIDCAVGLQINLNTDFFLRTNNLRLQLSDSITGFIDRNGYTQFTPTSASTNKTLRFLVYQDNNVYKKYLEPLSNKVVSFREIDRNFGGSGLKTINIMGDSLVNSDFVDGIFDELAIDNDFTIQPVGTRISDGGNDNEGHGGRTWEWFVTDEESPYVFSGVLDFTQYATLVGVGTMDIIFVALGTNDVNGADEVPNYDQIIKYATTFIDAYFTAFPSGKFILGLPPLGAINQSITGGSWSSKAPLIKILNRKYIEKFDNGKYHSNLTTVSHGAWINRTHAYPTNSLPIASRIPLIDEDYYTDTIHPTTDGYLQLADGVYSKIRAVLNGL